MRQSLKAVVSATVIFGTLFPTTFAAVTTGQSAVKSTITVNGSTLSNPYELVLKDGSTETAYMPMYYIDQALSKGGYSPSWNGTTHQWKLTTTGNVNLSKIKVGSGNTSIYVNGKLAKKINTVVDVDPASGNKKTKTTFVPIYYVQQLLKAAGVQNTWNGTDHVWAETVPSTTGDEIVALGDSITYGYNLGNNLAPSQYAFPFQIGKSDGNTPVDDLAQPGFTSNDVLSQLSNPSTVEEISKASIITLDIGSNDLLGTAQDIIEQIEQNPSYIPTQADIASLQNALQQFGQNLPKIIAGIRLHSSAPIVLYNIYDPFPSGTPLHSIAEEFIPDGNQVIAQVASNTTNCYLADAYTAFNGNQDTLVRVAESDVHPTIEGQIVLAQLAEKSLGLPLTPAGGVATGTPTSPASTN
ncbi:GDSL-type esterase/lipase family protein [Alicyclobacillus fastidiosus]|uniref:GDSL-type esterase/lipase family protein n=1 Tax=Alicyclobacillus fastidiosus TaxID=392011 RepID=A0ABV5AIA5_9BACL|nr:GDSL-type esterase/lipase family protein [Alicyclobacillus fastidiosus]WEH11123.1 GDSL-type esterase/lipase family protein [Alicyclobacillus fastidiosus]